MIDSVGAGPLMMALAFIQQIFGKKNNLQNMANAVASNAANMDPSQLAAFVAANISVLTPAMMASFNITATTDFTKLSIPELQAIANQIVSLIVQHINAQI